MSLQLATAVVAHARQSAREHSTRSRVRRRTEGGRRAQQAARTLKTELLALTSYSQRTKSAADLHHGTNVPRVPELRATAEHVRGDRSLLLLLLLDRSSRRGSGGAAGSRGGRRERRRVRQVRLVRVRLRERERVKLHHDRHERLEGVRNRVRDRRERREADLERHGRDVAETRDELGREVVLREVKHRRVEERAVVVHALDHETVRERADVELLEQHRLGVADLVALLREQHLVDDLNLALHNLRRDLERLEETRLTRVRARRTRRHDHVDRRQGTHTRGRWHLVRLEHLAHLREVLVREHEADVALEQRKELLERVARVLLHVVVEHLADERVLAHEQLGAVAERETDLLDLVRAHIVDTHQEDLGVALEHVLELDEVVLLAFLRETHGAILVVLLLAQSLEPPTTRRRLALDER
ncbi:hypothetical protein PybrP1_010541 [[Pythium] brassicae (nom. inval.)]|nr:hypothetical protein PybrP1_010541 [[Pythium] brassicae (nom. inval.)]